MTKPVTRKMAVGCILHRFMIDGRVGHDGLMELPCSVCGEPLLAFQNIHFDHIHADVFGGEHLISNLRPIHYDPCHKKKTSRDVKDNAKVKRIAAGGRKRKGPKMKSKGFQKVKRQFPKRIKDAS